MRICSIASGSSGNCIYVGNGKENILIDAGISRKRIVEGLAQIGVAPEEIDGIFVTHEHSDHISGIPMMVKMFGTKIFATGGTLDAICDKDKQRVIGMDKLFQLYPDETVHFGEMQITPFSISHDAADPVAYTVLSNGKKMGLATDLGVYNQYTLEHLSGSDFLLLEANHDVTMLEQGPYPFALKKRILSEQGHLSNEAAGSLLSQLIHTRLKYVFLGHLSKENNYPELAYQAVKCQIWEECKMNVLPFEMQVASRDEPSELIKI